MTTLRDILSSSSPAELSDRSLSRAFELWQQSGTESYALVTASADLDSTASLEKSLKMQSLVRDMGFGAVSLALHVDGEVGRVLFILGIPLRLAERLRQRCRTDWFLFCGEETGAEVVRYTADGPVERLGRFTPARIAEIFSTTGHEAFFEWRASGFVENLAVTVARRAGNLKAYPWHYAEVKSRSVARVLGQFT